jgi:signal transduction histidine kinase
MRRLFWSAHPLRALAETLVLETLLLLALLNSSPEPSLVIFSFPWLAILLVVLCGLRIRLPEGGLLSVIGREVGLTALAAGAMQGVFGLLTRSDVPDSGFSLLLMTPLIFFPLRLGSHLWRLWNATRQRRLLWAMVHAHLMTVLVIIVVMIVGEGIRTASQPSTLVSSGAATSWLVVLLVALTPIILGSIVAVPLVAGIMLLAGVISYFASRQITRRIEALAAMTGSLRAGRYNARIPVEGEDEIAQLQTDFNVMAADLERTLSALKTERDTVSGLLQTRRELVASVSHELRTPVATVRGYLESALKAWDDGPPPTLRHDLEVMERETIRLQALIDDLFTLSRAEAGRLTLRCVPMDAAAVIRRVVDTAAPLAWQSGRVQLVADLPSQLPPALADAGRLEQILFNLIHNSIRHTPPGGIIAATAGVNSGMMQIQVRDTGEGIAAEELPYIWERFYRGQSNTGDQNAGLGLALVKELTIAMGGTVSAESISGQGSCFSICLPTA